MGKEIHLSATAAVRRTLKGDTLSLSLQTNGVPLFQGLNPDTFTVSPKWSESGTHPIITPSVGSARKNNVTLTNHAWAYNGKNLGFSSSGTGWETSTVDNRFKLNHANGSLSIIGDLASKVNQDSDTLTYSGDAVLGASIYPMQKSIDILVSMLGGSSYFGGVSADTTVLSKGQTQAILRPWLFNSAGGEISTYTINLYRGSGTDLAGTYTNPLCVLSGKNLSPAIVCMNGDLGDAHTTDTETSKGANFLFALLLTIGISVPPNHQVLNKHLLTPIHR
jgi:hypothetical protein